MKTNKTEDKNKEKFAVEINPEEPLFVIGVVSQKVGLPIWTLRKLDALGVVQPMRMGKKIRCYSITQVKTLNYIYYLMEEKHVNISAIKFVLETKEV